MDKNYFGKKLSSPDVAERKRQREEKQALENRRLGLLVFQVSWMMAFMALIVSNWQLRFQYESWPPPGVRAMGIWLPTLATLSLLVGIILARRALRRIRVDDVSGFMMIWQIALVLTAIFVLIMGVEWFRVTGSGTQYRAVFRLMTGFHSLHAIIVGLFMVNIWQHTRRGQQIDSGKMENDGKTIFYNSENYWNIEATSKMLNFVFIAWMLFYVVLYLWRS